MDNGFGAAAAPQHAARTAIHAEIVWPQIKRHSIWPFSVPVAAVRPLRRNLRP
jgi:hypothetical protein